MQKMNPKLFSYCNGLVSEFESIPDKRKASWLELGYYIVQKLHDNKPARLTVICTANSRRSHMGQLWLQTAAAFYGIEKVETFSGGTEVSAFDLRAIGALQRAGFKIQLLENSNNPIYRVSFGERFSPVDMFSKKYDHEANPISGFGAIMVCSEADAACPTVPGAEIRFSLPFEDPKIADGTVDESKVYDKRCRQIAREMLFVMATVKKSF